MSTYRIIRPPHLLSDALREFLLTEAGRDFSSLLDHFPREWKVVMMGGLLRDLVLNRLLRLEVSPVDIDLVIFGASSIDEIGDKLQRTIRTTNSFGGLKSQLRVDGAHFDLWRVEDHTNVAAAPKPHTIEQLLRHNLLDVDAIVWDPLTDELHDCGCLDAIQAGRISTMGPQGISREFVANQVAHVLLVAFKTGFLLSDDVCSLIATASQRHESDIRKILQRKKPKHASQIESFWKDLLSGGTPRCPIPTRATL